MVPVRSGKTGLVVAACLQLSNSLCVSDLSPLRGRVHFYRWTMRSDLVYINRVPIKEEDMPTKRKYDYKCGACGHTATLELTMDDYEVQRGTGIVCGNCSHLMSRVYDVQVPRSTQLKGHYNSSYEGQKEFAKITKDGGEEVGK